MGRPSKYDPKFCDEAIEFMRDGFSVTALAGHIGVARSTIFKWAEEHEEFSDALKTAQALAALWWEKTLRTVASTGEGSASAAIFGVKNRSTEEWKDKHEVEQNVNQVSRVISAEPVSEDEWEKRYGDSLGSTAGASESAD